MRSLARILWLILILWLAACSGSSQPESSTAVFLPPTPLSTLAVITPTRLPLLTPQPTPVITCTNNLTYLEDLTLPDGEQVPPASQLDKRWKVRNSGTCNWDAAYTLRLIAGSELGSPPELPLYPARAGTEAVIQILFTSPQKTGSVRSAWQAYAPDGTPFGDPIFIEVEVIPPDSITNTP